MSKCQNCGKDMPEEKAFCVTCVEQAVTDLQALGYPIKERLLPSGVRTYWIEPSHVRSRRWQAWCKVKAFHQDSVETDCGQRLKGPECWPRAKAPRRLCKACHRADSIARAGARGRARTQF